MTQAGTAEQLDVHTASRKRRALAIYLDFLIFGTVWTLTRYWIAPLTDAFWGKVLIFVALEIIAMRLQYSPGLYILSIYRFGADDVLGVAPAVKSRETLLTMILATMLLIDGPRMMIRWTQFPAARPYFGFMPDYAVGSILEAAIGIAEIFAGIALLKMSREGFWAGLILPVMMIISMLMSINLFPEFLENYARLRAEASGREFRAEQIKIMVPLVVWGTVGAWAVYGGVCLLYRKRLTNPLLQT